MADKRVLGVCTAAVATVTVACSSAGSVFVQHSLPTLPKRQIHPGHALGTQGMQVNHRTGLESGPLCTFAVAGAAVVAMAAMKRPMARSNGKMQRKVQGGADTGASFSASTQPGAMEPLGFWDPADLLSQEGLYLGKLLNKTTADRFRWYREAELKHGRVAMMAAVGSVFQHYTHFNIFFKDVPNGLGALDTAPGANGFVLLVIATGLLEAKFWRFDRSKEAGNFNDPLAIEQKVFSNFKHTSLSRMDLQNYELNNGRMAMFMAIGIIAAECQTGRDAIQQMMI